MQHILKHKQSIAYIVSWYSILALCFCLLLHFPFDLSKAYYVILFELTLISYLNAQWWGRPASSKYIFVFSPLLQKNQANPGWYGAANELGYKAKAEIEAQWNIMAGLTCSLSYYSLTSSQIPSSMEMDIANSNRSPSGTIDSDRPYMQREADNIDARDAANPLLCTCVVNDMYEWFGKVEKGIMTNPAYMTTGQPHINERMRCILVDWLVRYNI